MTCPKEVQILNKQISTIFLEVNPLSKLPTLILKDRSRRTFWTQIFLVKANVGTMPIPKSYAIVNVLKCFNVQVSFLSLMALKPSF